MNRSDELGRLDRVLAGDASEPMVVAVTVIAGTAGVGKTSLALHWAHQVSDRFPDGQLYANLRGYDPGPRASPDQVLDSFLRALGVPAAELPADLDDRAALYRSLLAGRRTLIILDNAATVGQVRPLLPGTAGCLVLVTSRSHLSGLVFREGAHRVSLGVLTEAEAMSLLRTVIADYRADAESGELAELARLCARLPLALRVAAGRAVRRPRTPMAELIEDLRGESGLWDALSTDDEDEADAVRSVFAWSYRALPEDAARSGSWASTRRRSSAPRRSRRWRTSPPPTRVSGWRCLSTPTWSNPSRMTAISSTTCSAATRPSRHGPRSLRTRAQPPSNGCCGGTCTPPSGCARRCVPGRPASWRRR
ncbi:NB-ARC domain-containing protein [Actinokineospora sp. 24-640]